MESGEKNCEIMGEITAGIFLLSIPSWIGTLVSLYNNIMIMMRELGSNKEFSPSMTLVVFGSIFLIQIIAMIISGYIYNAKHQ